MFADGQLMLKRKWAVAIIVCIFATVETAAGATVNPADQPSDKNRQHIASKLPIEGRMPRLDGMKWIGSPALSAGDLKGKVVLVDFWTYSCINCIRVTPYLNAWADKYRNDGLIVLGVHTPEFSFEKRPENIEEETKRFHINYPVVVDSDYKIWNAFANQYWPAYYLVDGKGNIRYHQFGEGDYDKAEAAIQDLLGEAHGAKFSSSPVKPLGTGVQASPNLDGIRSPETYVGYREAAHFASPERVKKNNSALYSAGPLLLNQWALSGAWIVSSEDASLSRAGGSITYRFHARDLNLVMAPPHDGVPVRYQITINGQAPGEDHGADADEDGRGLVDGARLYQLIRQKRSDRENTFEIRFDTPGVKVFVFTFG